MKVERFWSKVKIVNDNECWEWIGYKSKKGYGQFRYNEKILSAHRVSWIIKHNINPELCVLHKCDNRKCVNPDHLFLGTQSDNVFDMDKKGRRKNVSSEDMWSTKLNIQDVLDIRNSLEKTNVLSKRYNVGRHTIYRIRSGRTWKNIEVE